MFERYTEPARRTIFFARYEASQLGSPYVETEHLLLGLLRQDKQLVNRFLQSDTVVSIRKQIEGRATFVEKISTSVDMPLSHPGKRVLAYASEESERLNQRQIGTEHFLLGLLREENCLAAEILREHGLSVDSVRETLRTPIESRVDDQHRAGPVFMLTLAEPKLQKADPSNATGFHPSPEPNPAARRVIACQNMTMGQFAENLPRIAPGYVGRATIVDATGLAGAWDFTLSFSPAGMEHRGWTFASDRESAISLFDALEQQLGLKLEETQPPAPSTRRELPFRFGEILLRAAVLARKAGVSEIGIDMLLQAMDSDAGSGLSDVDALLAAFASAAPDYAAAIPNGESAGSFDSSVVIELSSEVQGILLRLGNHISTEALRRALMLAKSRRTETGDAL